MVRKLDRACSKRTICEVHRQLYDQVIVHVKDPELQKVLKALIEEAFGMGVALVDKLVTYNIEMIPWETEEDKECVNALRKLRIELEKAEL